MTNLWNVEKALNRIIDPKRAASTLRGSLNNSTHVSLDVSKIADVIERMEPGQWMLAVEGERHRWAESVRRPHLTE